MPIAAMSDWAPKPSTLEEYCMFGPDLGGFVGSEEYICSSIGHRRRGWATRGGLKDDRTTGGRK